MNQNQITLVKQQIALIKRLCETEPDYPIASSKKRFRLGGRPDCRDCEGRGLISMGSREWMICQDCCCPFCEELTEYCGCIECDKCGHRSKEEPSSVCPCCNEEEKTPPVQPAAAATKDTTSLFQKEKWRTEVELRKEDQKIRKRELELAEARLQVERQRDEAHFELLLKLVDNYSGNKRSVH